MTLLAVKGFDDNNNEIISTVSVTIEDPQLISVLPSIRKLLLKNNHSNAPQGWIYEDKCVAFSYLQSSHVLFVAIANTNTSFSKLKYFLEALEISLEKKTLEDRNHFKQKEFQDLCDSLLKYVDSLPYINIALLGLARSGKTTFVQQHISGEQIAGFNSYKATPLVNIITVEGSSKNPQLRFYDLGNAFQQHWWKFSPESDGYIFFVDMSDSQSIHASKELFEEVRNFWDLPFVIAANKIDVCSINNPRRYLSRKLSVPIRLIYEVETQTGEGLTPLLEGLISEIQEETISPVIQPRGSKNNHNGLK